MKLRFFPHAQPEVRKNDRRISFISHDLGSAYTLPTPQRRPYPRPHGLAVNRRSKRHDA